MKKTAVKILKVVIKVLRAVLYALSGGHICKCKENTEDKTEK